jgi:predicted DCC family thiol-disulfide oxidoreductase YuxK
VAPASTPVGRHLVLYDGVCGLCNRLNGFVLKRDDEAVFAFASLQSEIGRSLLQQFGRVSNALDTMYVVVDYRSPAPVLLSKSNAALFVAATAGGGWRWLGIFRVLPVWLRDLVYDLIAQNRYRLFGKYDTCLLPTPEYRRRFIDASG